MHVDRLDPDSPAGVFMQLTFRNTSNQQQRVDNNDFWLEARGGNRVRFIVSEGCSSGGRTDMYPVGMPASTPLRDPGGYAAGATYTTPICFPNPGARPWTLIWEPDVAFGPLSEPIRIPLR